MNCKPYIDILLELEYFIIEDDIATYDSSNLDDDVYVIYSPIFKHPSKNAYIRLDLKAEGSKDVRNCFKDNDYTKLELVRLEAYYYGDDIKDYNYNYDEAYNEENNLIFFKVSTNFNDSKIQDIEQITPDIFKTILKIKESRETEFKHDQKILQRYLDIYYNIIVPIVNPVIKIKKMWFFSTINAYGFNTTNRNIELQYFYQDTLKFVIGINYVTCKTYFYAANYSDLAMDNFENKITTKGKMLKLLKEYGI